MPAAQPGGQVDSRDQTAFAGEALLRQQTVLVDLLAQHSPQTRFLPSEFSVDYDSGPRVRCPFCRLCQALGLSNPASLPAYGRQLGAQPAAHAAGLQLAVGSQQRRAAGHAACALKPAIPAAQGCPDCYGPKLEIRDYVRQSGVPHTLVTCSGFAEDWAAALGQMGPRWAPPGPDDETIIFGSGEQKGACSAAPASRQLLACSCVHRCCTCSLRRAWRPGDVK